MQIAEYCGARLPGTRADQGYEGLLHCYVQKFVQLGQEEGLSVDQDKLKRTLQKYPISEIERALDACLRFGLSAVLKSI